MANISKPSDTKQNEVKKKEKASIGGLLAKIDKIEKKLNLLSTMGKTMPVIVLSTGAILGSLIYLLSVATVPETSQLPATGEEENITNNFVMLYPENYSATTLPDDVIGLSLEGFYDELTQVTFHAQKAGDEIIDIGVGEKGSETGEYKTTWQNAPRGKYYIWAKITHESGLEYKSASVVVDIY